MKKVLFAVCGLSLAFAGCEKIQEPASEPAPSPTPLGGAAVGVSVNVANVVVHSSGGEAVTYAVEIVKTPEERAQGLQHRESLAADHGMWFVFDNDVQDPFWMKNTPLALDIIFVGSDNKIVDCIENAQPNSTDLLIPKQPYRYVLEVVAGQVAAHRMSIGDTIEFRIGS